MHVKLSIIIPSLGRQSLVASISSIVNDVKDLDYEILIIAHGKSAYSKIVSMEMDLAHAQIVLSDERYALSDLCNEGIVKATGNILSFFSDDDIWMPGRTRCMMEICKVTDGNFILVGRGNFINTKSQKYRTRPKVAIKNQQLFTYLYGKKRLFTNPNYFGLMNTFIKVDKPIIRFPMHMSNFEDLSWVAELQKNGLRILTTSEIFSLVRHSHNRSSIRINHLDANRYYLYIQSYSEDLANNFVRYYLPRPIIRSGNVKKYFNYLEIRKQILQELLFGDILIILIQLLTVLTFRFLKSIEIN